MNKSLLMALFTVFVLAGCGGGASESQVTIEENPNGDGSGSTAELGAVLEYTGPSSRDTDVEQFRVNFFNEYRAANRCVNCHGTGGQSPQFVREDNVNAAYDAIVPSGDRTQYVNLDNPSTSAIVAKVGSGHNCWSTNAVCRTEMIRDIEAWAGLLGSGDGSVVLRAPAEHEIDVSKQVPVSGADNYDTAVSAFGATIYPLFEEYGCDGCHRSDATNNQQPYFAADDLNDAYDVALSKIDIDDGVLNRTLSNAQSRFVVRMRSEFHNCGETCSEDAAEMLTEIKAFEAMIPSPSEIPVNWVTSKALVIERDGILASGGGRSENGVIAKWDFAEGDGNKASDSSDVDPAMTLTLDGSVEWVGGNGVYLQSGGKVQADTASSKKLSDRIKASGAYSVEAWVAPANTSQEGPARILTYSSGDTERNFTLGQTLYNYDFLGRSSTTSANGEPAVSTSDDAEVLQATLQHVILTYDPVNGRRIYVNGNLTDAVDGNAGGNLNGWDDGFVFIIGNEASSNYPWVGAVRFVAIYDRALTQNDITANFDAGVGQRYYLLFNVTDQVEIDDGFSSFVVMQFSVFDSYSYLIEQPFFYRIAQSGTDPDAMNSYSSIPVEGMRIGINGKEPSVGQAFAKMNVSLDSTLYTETGQELSAIGTVMGLEAGSSSDQFFLTFERIGSFTDVRVEGTVSPVSPTATDPEPDIGLRTFDKINASMAVITGVPSTNANVVSTYTTVKQQLPTAASVETFLSAHQMAVAQMAIEYCSELIDDSSLRSGFFPGFIANFDQPVDAALAPSELGYVIDPLYARVVGEGLESQPDEAEMKDELSDLMDLLIGRHGGENSDQTKNIVKATCAAALGSAAVLVH